MTPATVAHQTSSFIAGLDYCEYTDEYGYWSGDCATEADVDDALATVASLDSDVEGLQSDADDALAACEEVRRDCLDGHSLEFDAQRELEVGGPSAGLTWHSAPPCPGGIAGNAADLRIGTPDGCAGHALAAAAGLFGFFATKSLTSSLISRGALTASELFWTTGALIAVAFDAGWAIGSYIDCLTS